MGWEKGQIDGDRAQVNEHPDGKIEVLYNFTGSSDHSPHDKIVTDTSGMNAEYLREDGVVSIDVDGPKSDPNNAYPDRPA